ncbi:glucose uptake inhibitor SgrT [Sodalis sp. dw_96]|uniref:glucose uptake inhibitor SgrT n=1 Tax=Sodalis sp. dw_96 TaxID=2719794 RepID=UPI00210321DE|nr:glucose uptake inhibitor SgrT [Sodalis sp. dw_96]
MKKPVLRRFYQRYLRAISKGDRPNKALSTARMAILLQVTQWHIDKMPENEYQHWI